MSTFSGGLVHRWLRIAAVLCVAVATPLVAQQASSPAQQGAAAAPARSSRTTLPGPRLQPEWRSVEPAFTDSRASAAPVSSGTHTITVTTLVLVLVVIIAVLLIVK
jgi:hypothetical protein